jgi:hypothetical protein
VPFRLRSLATRHRNFLLTPPSLAGRLLAGCPLPVHALADRPLEDRLLEDHGQRSDRKVVTAHEGAEGATEETKALAWHANASQGQHRNLSGWLKAAACKAPFVFSTTWLPRCRLAQRPPETLSREPALGGGRLGYLCLPPACGLGRQDRRDLLSTARAIPSTGGGVGPGPPPALRASDVHLMRRYLRANLPASSRPAALSSVPGHLQQRSASRASTAPLLRASYISRSSRWPCQRTPLGSGQAALQRI